MRTRADPVYARKLGVDIDNLLCSAGYRRAGAGNSDALARSGAVDVIVVDSVAALIAESGNRRRNWRLHMVFAAYDEPCDA